jgi:hypothetical protein
MVLLGDEAQVKGCIGPFEDSANLDARQVHGLHRTYHRLRKSFYAHPMKLLGDVGHAKCHFYSFGDCVSVGAR